MTTVAMVTGVEAMHRLNSVHFLYLPTETNTSPKSDTIARESRQPNKGSLIVLEGADVHPYHHSLLEQIHIRDMDLPALSASACITICVLTELQSLKQFDQRTHFKAKEVQPHTLSSRSSWDN